MFLLIQSCINIKIVRENINPGYIYSKQAVSKIFPPSTGGAKQMASEMGVHFLGEIELDPRLGQCCDSGKSFLQHFSESRVSKAYRNICKGNL